MAIEFLDCISAFWEKNFTMSREGQDLSHESLIRILKICHKPIALARDYPIGDLHKPHIVLPEGSRGYIICYPEAFAFTEKQKLAFENRPKGHAAVWINGFDEIVYLKREDYLSVSPFFDFYLPNAIEEEERRVCA